MKGYNEVVMLRRLTERHKQHALWLLTKDRSKENDMKFYDGLYQLPHDDGLVSTLTPLQMKSPMFFPFVDLTSSFFLNTIQGEKPVWPSKESIEDCKRMG